MKKIFFLTTLVFLSSCSITERLIILPNDEVKIAHDIDLSQMLLITKSMGGGEDIELSNPKKQDTIFSFKSIIDEKKDSIAALSKEEQQKWKALEKYHFKMEMDESQDHFLMTVFADFSSINELKNMMAFDEILKQADVNPMGRNKLPAEIPSSPIKTSYDYDGNVFKRTSVKTEPIKNTSLDNDPFDLENPNVEQTLEMVKDLPIDMSYKLNYRFSKRIRATTVQNAKISPDRLSVDFEFDMKTYETDPEFLNLEIYFE